VCLLCKNVICVYVDQLHCKSLFVQRRKWKGHLKFALLKPCLCDKRDFGCVHQ